VICIKKCTVCDDKSYIVGSNCFQSMLKVLGTGRTKKMNEESGKKLDVRVEMVKDEHFKGVPLLMNKKGCLNYLHLHIMALCYHSR